MQCVINLNSVQLTAFIFLKIYDCLDIKNAVLVIMLSICRIFVSVAQCFTGTRQNKPLVFAFQDMPPVVLFVIPFSVITDTALSWL